MSSQWVTELALWARNPSAIKLRFVEQIGACPERGGLGHFASADLRQPVRWQPDLLERADPAFNQLLQEKRRLAAARFSQ